MNDKNREAMQKNIAYNIEEDIYSLVGKDHKYPAP